MRQPNKLLKFLDRFITRDELSQTKRSCEPGDKPETGEKKVKNQMGSFFDPSSEMMSSHFTLADLTVTSTGIENIPNDTEKKNLRWLAGTLDKLYDEVGPFRIASAFRSSAVQQRLKELGKPVAAKKSFHEAGMAADIIPLNKDLNQYFNEILAGYKDNLGEIALKDVEGQNAIHISMPTATTVSKVMSLDEAGNYVAMTADEIQNRIGSVIAAVEEFATEVASLPSKRPAVFWALIGMTALGIFALIAPEKRKA